MDLQVSLCLHPQRPPEHQHCQEYPQLLLLVPGVLQASFLQPVLGSLFALQLRFCHPMWLHCCRVAKPTVLARAQLRSLPSVLGAL